MLVSSAGDRGEKGKPAFSGEAKAGPVCSMGEKGRGHRDRGGVLGGSGEVGRDGAAFSPELAAREEETTPSFFQGLRRGGQGKRQHSLPLGTCIKRGQRGGRSLLLRTCARGLEESWGDLSPGSVLEEDEEKGGCGLSLEACDGGSQGER